MGRVTPAAAAIAAATALCTVALAAPAPATAARGCGVYTGPGGPYAVRILKGRPGCATARAVLRRYATATGPCEGSSCVRRQRGWTCQTAPGFAFPRLFSCQRRGQRVGAYSLAD